MPDGTYQAYVYSAPIHFKGADGAWQNINDTLTFDKAGVTRNAAGPATIEVASSSSGRAPIHIARDDWSLDMSFLGGLVGDQVDLGNKAYFSNVARSTDLAYDVENGDLKETLLLKSADAPATFSFSLTASGLALYPYRSGWAFFEPGSTIPSLYLGKLTVEDSAATPTVAADATMVVTPSASGAVVTYKIPQAWLSDPARVFPIRVDPSTNLYANKDTFVYAGNKYGTYGTQTYFNVGASTGNYYSYLAFDMSNTGIPASGYIDNASLCLYAQSHTGGGITMGCGQAAGPWDENMNYYGQPGYSQQLFTQALSANGAYNYIGSAAFTQLVKDWYWYWYSGGMSGQPNNGLELYQTTAYNNVWTFSSHESASNKPYLAIGYCQPTVSATTDHTTISADDNDTVCATVTVATGSNKGAENDVANVQLNSSAGAGGTRVDFVWDNGSVMYGASGYTWSAAPGGGYYGIGTASTSYIDPLTAQWAITSSSGTKYYTFKWKVKPAYGDYQNVPLGASAELYGYDCWKALASTPGQNVIPGIVTPSSTTQALGWWRSSAGSTLNDQPGVGRGVVNVSWPSAGATANGYKIMMYDGAHYQQVGKVLSSDATTWSTAGIGAYPGDSEISSIASGYLGNALYRAATPQTAEQSFTLPSVLTTGVGVLVTDGTYLYGRRWGGSTHGVLTQWHKMGTGLAGTVAGQDYGAVGADSGHDILSGFYLDGYLYEGYASSATTVKGVWKGASADSTATRSLTFASPLLKRTTGASLTGASGEVLLASDGEQIYSLAYQRDNGTFNGWRVRVYDRNGNWLGDHDIGASSYLTDGLLSDGKALYFIEWTGGDGARVTKVRMSDWAIANQWTLPQSNYAINGTYDSANNVFWLGRLSGGGTVYRYPGPGFDLRDNPQALYTRMGSGTYKNNLNYWFRIVPYNSAGDAGAIGSCPASTPTLQNRTAGVTVDGRHTSYDLGDAAHHSAEALLDVGALHLSATDLSIKSWGPDASLARTYDSCNTGTDHFTRGWLFSFDQSLTVSPGLVTFHDEDGETHSYTATQSAFFGPVGDYATLTTSTVAPNGGYYKLTFKDRSFLTFNASGRLVADTDKNGNSTTYTWIGTTQLIIQAANTQQIVVAFDLFGNVTDATYTTSAGTREVSYNTSAGTVTYYPATSDAYTVAYAYNGSGQLGSLAVQDYPSLGTNATWGFTYSSGVLSCEQLPGWDTNASNRKDITYGSSSATVTIYGQVNGANNTPVLQTYSWNPSGTEASHSNPRSAPDPRGTWSTTYDAVNEPITESSPLGHVAQHAHDANGNVLFDEDELGRRTSYVYDANNQCIRETDARGDTTYRTYDASGNLTAEDRQLNATERAHTAYNYNKTDHAGLVTAEFKQVNATSTAETDYSNFASSGDPQTITQVGVERVLTSGHYGDNLTTTKSYNAFGDLLSEKDAFGYWVTEDTGYTPAGRVSSSTDGTGTITHHTYDVLGNETETSRTAGSAFADWVSKSYDVQGRLSVESFWADRGALDHTVTHSYDPVGHELTVTDSAAGATTNYYDAAGNTLSTWGPGADTRSLTAASRATFDIEGNRLTSTDAGVAASSTVSTYFGDGSVKKVINPDGSWTSYTYDDGKNPITETHPTADGGTASDVTAYDIGGRVISKTTADGETTNYTYDLLDHQLTAKGSSNAAASTNVCNNLGWVLFSADAAGVQTCLGYDLDGRVGTKQVGNAPTQWFTHDVMGNVTQQSNSDGSGILDTYDAFGRKVAEGNYSGSAVLKCLTYAHDTLSRSTGSTDTVNNIAYGNTYGAGGSIPTTSTMAYAGVTSRVSYSAAGTETACTANIDGVAVARSSYVRDGANHLTSWIMSGMPLPGSAKFDGAGRVSTQGGYGWDLGATYGYGPTGLKTNDHLSLLDPNASYDATYTYDSANRLASCDTSSQNTRTTTAYFYGSAGDITTVSASGLPTTTFAYDALGRLATTTAGSQVTQYSYDSTGTRIAAGPVRYTWDNAIHLSHYHDGSRSVDATFTYDGNGQRSASVVTSGGVTTTTTYTYDGLTLLSLSAVDSANATYTITYLYDENGRPYAASYKGTDATTPVLFHLITTDRGDVVELLTGNGSPFARYRYDAWGNPTTVSWAATGSVNATQANDIANQQPLRYAGYAYDTFSSLYYLSARYYDPATMQFISEDPAKTDGERSAYQYCSGDPIGHADPTGRARLDWSITQSGHPITLTLVAYRTNYRAAPTVWYLNQWVNDVDLNSHARVRIGNGSVMSVSISNYVYEYYDLWQVNWAIPYRLKHNEFNGLIDSASAYGAHTTYLEDNVPPITRIANAANAVTYPVYYDPETGKAAVNCRITNEYDYSWIAKAVFTIQTHDQTKSYTLQTWF